MSTPEIEKLLKQRYHYQLYVKQTKQKISDIEMDVLDLAFTVGDIVQDSILPRKFEYLGPVLKGDLSVFASIRCVGTNYRPRQIPIDDFLKHYRKTHSKVN